MKNMKNMTTYAEKYRNTSFTVMPFSEVDGLVLCQIAYYDFALMKMEKEDFSCSVSEYLQEDTEELIRYLVTVNGDVELIDILRKGGRHGGLKVANYIEETDLEHDQQFSAITFEVEKGKYFIAFRGTDNSIVGWKEDFNMSHQDAIPSQKKAVQYAIQMMEQYDGKFYLGGHSKGGNLAAYTGMMLPEHLQERLICIYNYDGPGFLEEVYEKAEYKRVRPMIRKMIPQTSIVGMLLEEDSNYAVVKSSATGFMQHNPFTWVVEDDHFEILKDADAISNHLKGTLNRWIKEMEIEKRKQFVKIVFEIIDSTGISNLGEVSVNRKEKVRKLLEHLSHADPEETKLVFTTIGRFIQASAREFRQQAKERQSKQPFWKKRNQFRL